MWGMTVKPGKMIARREEQGAQVVGVGEDTEGCRQQVGPFFLAQVMAQLAGSAGRRR